jgi:hypothetical protein
LLRFCALELAVLVAVPVAEAGARGKWSKLFHLLSPSRCLVVVPLSPA